jgi:glutathione S-transferase
MREITLYDSAISGNSYKCRLLLAQLELPYQRVPVDILKGESRTEAFRKLNPFYRVPFLTDGDFGLAESNAILLYLARGSRYLPDDPRAQALVHQWLFFEQNQLEASIALSRFVLRWEPDAPNTRAIVETQRRRGLASLKVIEEHFSKHDFAVGDYSVADIALFGYTPLAPEGGFPLDDYPAVRRWLDRVRAQPRFIPMV